MRDRSETIYADNQEQFVEVGEKIILTVLDDGDDRP
jgi:hypothetical protein